MIDLYYWGTPNGHKITIALEEMGLSYQILPVNILENDQFQPDFLAISPNNKIPAIVDQDGPDHRSISIFESGAILQYLGRKTGLFYPTDEIKRIQVEQWLMWQMGGLGPMLGQNHHFSRFAPERIPYATERYVNETKRLYGVLDKQLVGQDYVTGEYSIADMAIFPWLLRYEWQGIDLADYPEVSHYIERMQARPAVQKALAIQVS
ncbi:MULTISPECIES: glutathione S-transferase N-terminal domain-containing protein [Acinetobacter]|mgnify:CR=1 FL=1|jgi:GSH-dependent disulfide-bond oxidoreductase|uniref:glutathione S-transferase N-terminal domain-containing protein n=1 Tax=Acinetobacter TaxID=469 RepID=UPI000662B61C|nr:MULTISPECIES: glutathione S-transferase N-terminal domain-containing protein [Acinetobacter]AWD70567.1 thiol:disulfide oxidoreductase [Acinetobacter schindleri]KMV00336.1 glutathione S-transferase [Acinetobacter sp. VT 511]MDP1445214.1 glutathione S-transferase N-terminal domain-containing protein [Acinetobacter schindleri]PUR00853.1 thiol:disulfide oxidoreductase [Acinetobacter schindleri]UOH74517.1 glutathione S-transferase N-terminal domain-containing protein [Acinetobacter schindleri]